MCSVVTGSGTALGLSLHSSPLGLFLQRPTFIYATATCAATEAALPLHTCSNLLVHSSISASERGESGRGGREGGRKMSGSVETQARAFADEVRGGALEAKNWMLDLGHPLLNRVAESFIKAAGVSTPRASVLFAPSCTINR